MADHRELRLVPKRVINHRRRGGSLRGFDTKNFHVTKQLREALLAIPARLAADLAAETDQQRIHWLLDKEIRQILDVFGERPFENCSSEGGVFIDPAIRIRLLKQLQELGIDLRAVLKPEKPVVQTSAKDAGDEEVRKENQRGNSKGRARSWVMD